MTLMQWLRGTPPQPDPRVEEARRQRTDALAQLEGARRQRADALDQAAWTHRQLADARGQLEKMRAGRDTDTDTAQLDQIREERDEAIGQRDYTKGLLASLRTELEQAHRDRDRAARERNEARQDLAGRTYRHGGPAQPQSVRAEVLAERARADQLADRLEILQRANMARDQPIR